MKLHMKWSAVCLLVIVQAVPSFGDEIVPIGSILADPSLFTNRLTTIRVVQLDLFLPKARVRTKACPYHDRYLAIIDDNTGSMEAIVCGAPLDERGAIFKGDTIVLRAVIIMGKSNSGESIVLADGVRMERVIERP